MNVLISILPIMFILLGIVILKKPAKIVAFITMLITVILGIFIYRLPAEQLISDGRNAITNALYIAAIILGAFTLLNLMKFSGALDKINHLLLNITNDKRALVIIVAFGFGGFLEGAAGGGSPAAIVTPFLVGLGFQPLMAITAGLLSNGLFAAFGGAGNPVVSGVSPIAQNLSVQLASKSSGLIIPILGLIFPILLIYLLYGKEGLINLKAFLLTVGFTFGITMFIISNYIGPELVSLLSGTMVMLVSYIYIKTIGIDTPEEFKYSFSETKEKEPWENYTALQAFSPYILVLLLLPLVRFSFPIKILSRYGYGTWVGSVIFICAVIGMIILKQTKFFGKIVKKAILGVIPAFITMVSLLVIANIMRSSGMMLTIAQTLANTSLLYPFIAVFIGSLGSFMTGTAAGANIMFAPLHLQTSQLLNMNIGLLFGANNTGSSLGNAICPNNIVAVSTVVGLPNQEGEILKRVFKGWGILILIGGLISLFYNFIIPNFGML